MDNLTFSQEDYLLEEAREKDMEKTKFTLEEVCIEPSKHPVDIIIETFDKAYALGYQHGEAKGRREEGLKFIEIIKCKARQSEATKSVKL